jgi:hypothetical protein
MKVLLAIVLAYALTGLFFVRRDLREENPLRVVPFVIKYQHSGGWLNLFLAGLGWLPATIIAACWKPNLVEMSREVKMIALFILAIFVLHQLISN